MAAAFVRAEKLRVVENRVGIELVPGEGVVAAGRYAAEREVAVGIGIGGLEERAGAPLLRRWKQSHDGIRYRLGVRIDDRTGQFARVGAENDGQLGARRDAREQIERSIRDV